MESIRNKVVLITGASGGIGAGTALEFARLGARLVLTGRDVSKLQAVAAQCRSASSSENVVYVTADVTIEADLNNVVDVAVQNFGTIDILVNNAGIPMVGSVTDGPVEDLDRAIDVNVRSAFVLTQKVAQYIIENKGHIINVSSVAGLRANSNMVPYCITKRALDVMTKALALELGPRGVHVNSVNPDTVEDTDIWTKEGANWNPGQVTPFLERMKSQATLGRLCKVKDVAKAVVFLASDNCSFVTGYNFPIDGGMRNKPNKPRPTKAEPPK